MGHDEGETRAEDRGGTVRERALLEAIALRSAGLSARFPQVLIGPGDDCAMVEVGRSHGPTPSEGDDAQHRSAESRTSMARAAVLVTTDQVIEGRHFVRGTPLDLVARKAVARSISDLAAMGVSPLAAVATGALPARLSAAEADALCVSMKEWSERFGCPMVGGDLAVLPGVDDPMVLTTTVLGVPHPTRGAVLRSGARVGDEVYVTGVLGGSLYRASGLGRHLTFEPRVREAQWLCRTLGAGLTAMMDLSDGLGIDASRMSEASGVRLEIEAARVPRSAGVDSWRRAASDGEDYELLFCVSRERSGDVPERCPETGVAITRVGVVRAAGPTPGAVIIDGGVAYDGWTLGFEHGRT